MSRSALEEILTSMPTFGRRHALPNSKLRAEIELAERNPATALATLYEMKQLGMSPKAGWWNIEWREALAQALSMAGRFDEAANVHEEMLGIYRGHKLSHYDLGKIYEEMGRAADAEQQYVAFLEAWAEADEGLPQLEDAKRRLAALRPAIQ